MKKFTSLLLALSFCATLFAQLPNGAIAPNFTATDINGNTYELYDILDQGKTVLIDFSATWVAPSWGYHNTNVLQDFYELHGPSGDNTAMVFFVEGDTTTNVACLTGPLNCNNATQGDWTAGKTYPFIDDADGSLISAFNIGFFPTIYMICSDKVIEEIGQPNLPALENITAVCPVILGSTKLLRGTVVKDANADCIADTGEIPLANWGVVATGQDNATRSTITNNNGDYRLYIDSTNAPYTLNFTPPNLLWDGCPAPAPVAVTGADTITVDYAATAAIDCPMLSAEISTPMLRRCFDNHFSVEVCNDGTILAADAYVDVTLPTPEFLTASAATLPYTTLSVGVYRFDLGDLEVGDCVDFKITAELSCDSTIIGQTLCYEAHAYPDTLCIPSASAWNGSTVTVGATCTNGMPSFNITNTGTAAMSSPSSYIIIEDDVMRDQGTFQLNVGESTPVNVQGNGSTWRIEATQVPNHPNPANPSVGIEGCTVTGTNGSLGFITAFSTYDPSTAHDIECMEIIGSWDPNDKTGYPLGVTDQNLISKNTDIDYHIRFQNTGNDTAFTVVVRDTLSAFFNPRTIELGASSHPYEYALENDKVMVFTFNDIKLVDSFANEPLSHGFLKFKIAQLANLPDGTELTNSAAIYFDFNEPVITNTTLHRIGEVPHVSKVRIAKGDYNIEVYPNPLNGAVQLHTDAEMPNGSQWALYDFSGKKVAQGLMDGNAAPIGKAIKTAGMYHIQFSSKDGRSLGGATIMK